MGASEVQAFLTHPTLEELISASAHNYVPIALLFLYLHGQNDDLPSSAQPRTNDRVQIVG